MRRLLVLAAICLAGASCATSGAEPARVADDPMLVTTTTLAAPTTSIRPPTTSRASTVAPATTVAAAATTAAPPTTTTVALPLPQPVPANDRAPEPEIIVGAIRIPKIGLDALMYEGVTLTTLDRGPGHWPGTAMPGGIGNVVVAGHRVTHTHPFRRIDELVPGDEVIFAVGDQEFTYAVRASEVVAPDALWIVDQTAAPTATLFACHPPGSARYRYVVHLDLVTA